jgi:hypothetical protein
MYLCLLVALLYGCQAYGNSLEERIRTLEETVEAQGQTIKKQQEIINKLQPPDEPKSEAMEKSGEATKPSGPFTGLFGGSWMTNPYISLVLDTFAYWSDRTTGELENQGIPGYTTNGLEQRRGFNLRAAELFLFAPVDPYFNLYATIPVSEEGVELEEAYFVTTSLPAGFQVKGGRFKSNFSRLDAQHPHAWDFVDIALPYRAFLGDEGLGGDNGVQLTYLPPLPFYLLLGGEALQGNNGSNLFGEDAQDAPHAFSLFAKSSFDTSEYSTLYFGPYVLFGKTRTDTLIEDAEFRGNGGLVGIEAVWKWKPSKYRGLTLQGEYLYLRQDGKLEDSSTRESLRRRQDGLYLQGLYQFCRRWRIGARYDMLELFADTFKKAGMQQDLGSKPWRATGALEFNPTEFSRIRLQYTHDCSSRDGSRNDEVFLQFILGIGAHATHAF